MVTRVIAIMNQKGGVGKTTTAINLSHALALSGQKVLALDLDPQANLSAGFALHAQQVDGMDSVLLNDEPLQEKIIHVRDNLDVVPAGKGLANMEHVTGGGIQRGMKLKQALTPIAADYDVIICDCPPAAGLLGMNAIFAATELLIPVSSDYLSLQGLSHFMTTLDYAEKIMHRPIFKRIVMTRFHVQRRLAREVRDKLVNYFPDEILDTHIRENVSLAECPSYGETIFEYQSGSHGANDYSLLARELLSKSGPALRH